MGLRDQQFQTPLNAVQDTGAGKTILCEDHRHLNFALATAGMGAGDDIVVKVQGSLSDDVPDFDAAQSASNIWDYIDCKDMENTEDYDGDTGILFEDSNDVKQFSINVDGLKWITLNVTTMTDKTSTSLTAIVKLFND